eukprot:scaffold314216_cov47-Attheya_sp.AAC.2
MASRRAQRLPSPSSASFERYSVFVRCDWSRVCLEHACKNSEEALCIATNSVAYTFSDYEMHGSCLSEDAKRPNSVYHATPGLG